MPGRFCSRALTAVSVVAVLGATGCDEQLDITNLNNPDVERAFSSPVGVETIVSKLFQQMHQGQYFQPEALWPQTMTMSFESSSQLGNFGMGTRGQIPRAFIDNTIGNREEIGNFRDFDHLTRNARIASNSLDALKAFATANLTIGTPLRDLRAQSFAWFTLGFAHGYLALFYDSAAITRPGELTEAKQVPPYSGYAAVGAAALQMLDSALAIANRSTIAGGDEFIPAPWMAASTGISLNRWRQIIRSYRARFRAGYGRTPAERGAADWTQVLADASNGIQSDIVVQLSQTLGWTNGWVVQAAVSTGWHQMTPFIIGMADTTRAYDAWLAASLTSRAPFLIRSPDRRFPAGERRQDQQAVTPAALAPDTILFFRNRPGGQDTPAEPWGTSFYDHIRFWYIRNGNPGNGNGPFPIMTVAEIDMLAAEAHLRAGSFAAAAALIDKYRLQNGLPSVASVTTAVDPVPGGNACVPRIPVGPNYTSTACGTLFEAMKWEKRMETAFTGYGQWYIDSRGWGDLVQGTPLEWPVPYQELFARGKPSYRSERVAARGTYGF
jgi:hypothetical protein